MKKICLWFGGGLVIIFVIAALTWIGIEQRRAYFRNAITTLRLSRAWSGDGREAQIFIGDNENRETRIVLITHHDAIAPNWNKIDPRTRFSTADPVLGLRSDAKLVSHYPPDPTMSGLWVDGQQHSIDEQICVVFVSERLPATRITLSESEQDAFDQALVSIDPDNGAFDFIDEWIMPRLPKAPPGPTVDEIIRSLKSRQ